MAPAQDCPDDADKRAEQTRLRVMVADAITDAANMVASLLQINGHVVRKK